MAKKRKNIALIIYSLYGGGAERIVGLLSKELSSIYNVFLFLADQNNIVYEYEGEIVDIGYSAPFYDRAIGECKKKYEIDVSISFLEIMNIPNIRTRGNDKVIISKICTTSLQNPRAYSDELLIKRWYEYADEIIAISHGVEYEINEIYQVNHPVKTIYNFINKQKILRYSLAEMKKEIKDFIGNDSYYINVGRLHEQKGQDELIELFAASSRCINSKLIILGSGNLLSMLNDRIIQRGMSNRIKIFPFQNNPFPYIRNAKAFIFNSRYEGLGNVLMEAMTLGCPIISADSLAGPRELLDDNTDYQDIYRTGMHLAKRGILINADNFDDKKKQFDSALKALEEDSFRNTLINNGKSFMDNWENEDILKEWISVIERERGKRKQPLRDDFDICDENSEIYIYGYGKTGMQCYADYHNKYKIKAFIVTDRNDAGKEIYGIPVLAAEDIGHTDRDIPTVIGVSPSHYDEVVGTLKKLQYKKIIYP